MSLRMQQPLGLQTGRSAGLARRCLAPAVRPVCTPWSLKQPSLRKQLVQPSERVRRMLLRAAMPEAPAAIEVGMCC